MEQGPERSEEVWAQNRQGRAEDRQEDRQGHQYTYQEIEELLQEDQRVHEASEERHGQGQVLLADVPIREGVREEVPGGAEPNAAPRAR